MRREQRNKGRKLKTPDALIIATSMEHGLTLVSRDQDMKFVEIEYQLPMKYI
jgi:predicted nucleic acid-binding protein